MSNGRLNLTTEEGWVEQQFPSRAVSFCTERFSPGASSVGCRDPSHAIRPSPDASAPSELLHPPSPRFRQCLQPDRADASLELLHSP